MDPKSEYWLESILCPMIIWGRADAAWDWGPSVDSRALIKWGQTTSRN